MDRIPMTARGFGRLENELKHLKTVERSAVIKAIADARALGDLSENAEYHAAREKQSFIEGRIAELEAKLSVAEVIDSTKMQGNTVRFGATVEVIDEETGQSATYQIVGADESDIKEKLLSVSAPLARALIGKNKGDSVEVKTPAGTRHYEIATVIYR